MGADAFLLNYYMATGQPRSSQISGAQDLVTPRDTSIPQSAIDALTDSFRKGQITVSDVLQRKQQRDQQKAVFAEQMSPVMVEGRRAEAELGGAKARAGLPLVQPTAELAQVQLELQAAEAKYGPGIKLFQTLSPEAGIVDQPLLANGKPDYAKQAEIGLQLAAAKLRKTNAIERLKIPSHGMREGTNEQGQKVLFKLNEFGEHVTPELEAELRKQAAAPLSFQQIQPGTVAPAAAAPAAATPAAPAAVEPAAPAAAPQIGETIPGQGLVIGAASPKEGKVDEQKIAELEANNNLIDRARSELVKPGVVGPAAGSAPVKLFNQLGAAFGVREGEFQSQRELEMLISKKILEGAQTMKGNLSDKDVRFLRETAPKLSDTPDVWNRFLDDWKNMNLKTAEVLSGKAVKGSSILTPEQLARLEQLDKAKAGGATERKTLPSGAVMGKGADGVWRLEKAPTNLAPPAKATTPAVTGRSIVEPKTKSNSPFSDALPFFGA
jgi:hypothetical protein